MQTPHEFIGVTPLSPCQHAPTMQWGAPSILSPPTSVRAPLPQRRSWVFATTLLRVHTQMLKSENLYKPIYFETADYGVLPFGKPKSAQNVKFPTVKRNTKTLVTLKFNLMSSFLILGVSLWTLGWLTL
ncbi:hypothetical protein B9Q13_03775 [Candidatus Marsarchaeota G2 archaeon ECH_B_SAG-G16]|uniref:Uncharacterized protein n=1 Tax=Candidatus Marsarchaeota G2 archaeon ECH_B_SAG-G16 TaxID=1978167 RepID=A0A2R6C1G9_9ARCH|nr:MAG: hypothetical protein B9Q13_03775 [Candidatus Marsarchaeota G2 archaeon ECH_B_SAG-G16]